MHSDRERLGAHAEFSTETLGHGRLAMLLGRDLDLLRRGLELSLRPGPSRSRDLAGLLLDVVAQLLHVDLRAGVRGRLGRDLSRRIVRRGPGLAGRLAAGLGRLPMRDAGGEKSCGENP